MWTGDSTAAMKIVATLQKGAEFTDPAQEFQTTRPIDGFVDDTTGCTNQFTMELLMFATERHDKTKGYKLLKNIVSDAQQLAQRWERLLWSTGGKLELTKCFTYIIHWVFNDNGKPQQATNKYLEDTLQIPPIAISNSSNNGKIETLEQKECDEPHKTLGAKIAPDQLQWSETKRLKSKSSKMSDDVRFARATPAEANTFTQSIYIPAQAYSFPATSIE